MTTTHSNNLEGKLSVAAETPFISSSQVLQVVTSEVVPLNGKFNLKSEISPLVTLRQFCSVFSWPSESAMRAYIFKAEELGISEAFIRVSRRVLVDPQKFFSLIRQMEKPHSNKEKANENFTRAIATRPKGNN